MWLCVLDILSIYVKTDIKKKANIVFPKKRVKPKMGTKYIYGKKNLINLYNLPLLKD